jgi:hypothetical protein
MKTEEEKQIKVIETIMDEFDFHKVQRYMESVNWRWADCEDIPSVTLLRRKAKEMLMDAVKLKFTIISSGGFRVHRTENSIHLSFMIEEYSEE